jgi:hypothetical protein
MEKKSIYVVSSMLLGVSLMAIICTILHFANNYVVIYNNLQNVSVNTYVIGGTLVLVWLFCIVSAFVVSLLLIVNPNRLKNK